jgi:hypothetical protein
MTTPTVSTAPVPSIATLAKTTAIALVVAGVILITLVLPAEYGIDPLGTGERLGLTALANPPVALVEMPKTEGAALVPVMKGPIGEYPSGFKFDVFEIELAPYEYVEYKYSMEQGASMLFAWTATGGLRHDMHAERAKGAGDGPAEESFDKQDRKQGTGSYAAPFTDQSPPDNGGLLFRRRRDQIRSLTTSARVAVPGVAGRGRIRNTVSRRRS